MNPFASYKYADPNKVISACIDGTIPYDDVIQYFDTSDYGLVEWFFSNIQKSDIPLAIPFALRVLSDMDVDGYYLMCFECLFSHVSEEQQENLKQNWPLYRSTLIDRISTICINMLRRNVSDIEYTFTMMQSRLIQNIIIDDVILSGLYPRRVFNYLDKKATQRILRDDSDSFKRLALVLNLREPVDDAENAWLVKFQLGGVELADGFGKSALVECELVM